MVFGCKPKEKKAYPNKPKYQNKAVLKMIEESKVERIRKKIEMSTYASMGNNFGYFWDREKITTDDSLVYHIEETVRVNGEILVVEFTALFEKKSDAYHVQIMQLTDKTRKYEVPE